MIGIWALLGLMSVGLSVGAFGGHPDDPEDDTAQDPVAEPANGTENADLLAATDLGALAHVQDGDPVVLDGGDGDDVIRGGTGDDTLRGNTGVDDLFGGLGHNLLVGGAGNDSLSGYADDLDDGSFEAQDKDTRDYLFGSDGDDELILGNDDYATGGAGADVFVTGSFVAPGQEGRVQDFDVTEDRIEIYYDPAVDGADPVISAADTGRGQFELLFDGVPILNVVGEIPTDPDQILLVATTYA